jgi:hypothetical protein
MICRPPLLIAVFIITCIVLAIWVSPTHSRLPPNRLISDYIDGGKRVCQYSDNSTLYLDVFRGCPLVNG